MTPLDNLLYARRCPTQHKEHIQKVANVSLYLFSQQVGLWTNDLNTVLFNNKMKLLAVSRSLTLFPMTIQFYTVNDKKLI